MAFTVEDFHDLVELLEQNPAWRAELRRLVLSEEMLDLPRVVQELGERVQELAERVQELAEKVRDLTEKVQELAEAQKRTERKVEELAEAQKRTERKVEELAEAQKRTQSEVGRLGNLIGVTLEQEAADVLRVVLDGQGYRVQGEELNVRFDGEVDVALAVEAADGRRLVALVESKARLSGRAVEAWAKRSGSDGFRRAMEAQGIEGPYLVYVYGMRIDVSARDAAEKLGLGLLTSRGEVLPHRVR